MGVIAQLVERYDGIVEVCGSIPHGSTIHNNQVIIHQQRLCRLLAYNLNKISYIIKNLNHINLIQRYYICYKSSSGY